MKIRFMRKWMPVMLAVSIVFGMAGLEMPAAEAAKANGIPFDAAAYNGHYYKVFDQGLLWTEAAKACADLGGHLCTITGGDEQQFVGSLIAGTGNRNGYWLGGKADANGKKWEWITGEKWSYTNWDTGHGQPGAADPDKVYLEICNRTDDSGAALPLKWTNASAGGTFFGKNRMGYICEWDAEKSSKPAVKTGKASEITANTATIAFKVSSLGGKKISKAGIEYGYSKSKTKLKKYGAISKTGTYTIKLTGLKEGKKVYYRAFAKNKKGTVYGSWKSFKTGGSAQADAQYRALLIGNSDYRYESDLPNHKYDVKSMKALLGTTLKTKYKVTDKYDCTASKMLSAIRSAFSGATENDVSLFYFAGHGMSNSGAIIGVDGQSIWPDELRDALLAIPGRVIVLLECCHSGAYITKDGTAVKAEPETFNRKVIDAFSGYKYAPGAGNEDASKTGELMTDKFIVLTACSMYEESWNWWYFYAGGEVYDGYGTFTRAMFNGLGCAWNTASFSGTAPCDRDHDGIATLGECRKYIKKWATSINDGNGTHNVQTCMSYGDSSYPLFRLK